MTFFDYMPSIVYDGRVYDPKCCELVQRIERGNADLYLMVKPDGELFVIEHTDRFFYAKGRLLMSKFLGLFDQSLIPEKALKFHGWSE